MDVEAMPLPPTKRRKLSSYMQDAAEHNAADVERSETLPYAVRPVDDVRLAQFAQGHRRGHQALLPRQGTVMPSITASNTAIASSTEASTPAASRSSANTASVSNAATASALATSTNRDSSISSAATPSADLALSVSLEASLSLPLSDIPGVVTGLPISVVSGLVSDVSGLLAPSNASGASNARPSSEATITTSTSSTSNETTSVSNSSAANYSSIVPSAPSTSSSSAGNSTTSSLLTSHTGFTTSSFSRNTTTIPAASRTESPSSIEPTSSITDSALAFFATLSQGDVSTSLRSDDAYTTTFGDIASTIAAASTPSLSDASATSSMLLVGSTLSVGEQTSVSTSSPNTRTSVGSQYTSTSSAAPASTEPAFNSDSRNGGSSSAPPAGTIAGGVVGGAAGLAVLVLIAMLAIRWYRRQGFVRHQALPQGPIHSPDPNAASSSGPGMAERAGLAPFVAAMPALFRNHNRDDDGSETAQRGFTRVSGRKLPSAYSGGSAMQPPPVAHANLEVGSDVNVASYYRDSAGSYDGDASFFTAGMPLGSDPDDRMTMSPGPQRTPQIHSGGPYNMSPGPSMTRVASTLTRSDAPFLLDPNRNSRFSEGL